MERGQFVLPRRKFVKSLAIAGAGLTAGACPHAARMQPRRAETIRHRK